MSLDASTWAWRQRLKSSEKLVLLAMADRAGEDHKCYPSIARIAFDTGLNRKTVTAVLGRLRESGMIKKTGRMVGHNFSVPEYQLVGVVGREEMALQAMSENGHDPNLGMPQNRDGNHTQNWVDPKVDIAQKRDRGQTQKRVDHHAQIWVTESPMEPPNESPSEEYYSVQEKRCEIICTLPLNDGSDFEVTRDLVAELTPLYPNVEVVQALRAMKGWLIGNPKRRKTRRGIKAFITGWLSREQDKPRAVGAAQPQGQAPLPRSYRDCVDLEQRQENEFLNQLQEQLDGKRDSGANTLGAGKAQSAIASEQPVPSGRNGGTGGDDA